MKRKEFLSGVKAALPIVFGYIPVGMAFGVLAAQIGLTVSEVFFMSLLVYAGSGQFVAVSLMSAGASAVAIIFTTFLVNSRHILMSAALVPHVRNIPRWSLPLISYGITDETFAVAMGEVTKEKKGELFFLGLNITSQSFWILSTVIGASVGNIIPDPRAFGLHFAMPAMFIALLIMQIKNKKGILLAMLAIGLSILFKSILPGNWNIILATILTATIGVMIEKWTVKYSPSSSG
ncbi:MAG: AzlC family ABC transporter permease [Clostridia bacterium]|nr:AzlC family ABC transporter permease [Clostridia bacterium]